MNYFGNPSKTEQEKLDKSANFGKLNDLDKNPCLKETQISYKCLSDNKFDKTLCSNAFQNYRNCRRFWSCVAKQRGKKGIEPQIPLQSERSEARHEYKAQFMEYDFKNDSEFLAGWRELSASLTDQNNQTAIIESYLAAKLFYFSKKINLSDEQQSHLRCEISQQATGGSSHSDINDSGGITTPTQHPSQTDSEAGEKSTRADATGSYPASFKQVMECIEKGVEVPGVEHIVVEPTNDTIASGELELPKKPWEICK